MDEVNLAKAPAGVKLALMGNEAIARGVIESGTYVVTGYPGTPSSEVVMTLQEYSGDLDIYVEWAVNERVAFEVGLGASIGGARSLVTMKGPGLNVASDPLISAAYSGVDGGLIVLVADDPGPITTQTEQDSRWYGKLAKLPMITPSTPQEAKDMVIAGQNLSEELKLPVILRTTTRVNHTVAEVVTGDLTPPKKFMSFAKDQPRFVRAGMAWNLERHKWLNKQLTLVEDAIEKYGLNKVEGEGPICLITEGVTYAYVKEVVGRSPDNLLKSLKILRLGLIHPLPKRFLDRNLSDCGKVLVVEELDPFIEEGVKNLAFDAGLNMPIYGKLSGYLPLEGELNTDLVSKALSKLLGSNLRQLNVVKQPAAYEVHARPPPLCPGCPHRNSYLAILLGLAKAGYKRDEIPIFGDIGCYALSVNPPLSAIWTEHSMGASISMAMGLKLAGFNKPVIATIGDSTFYHAGIQPLTEAVNKRVDMLVVILDNEVVAMTGHQPTPAWDRTGTGRHTKPVDLHEVVKALGVDRVSVVNPYRIDEMIEKVREFIKEPGVNVLIAKAPCALLNARLRGVEKRYQVLLDKCTGCLACVRVTGCPALYVGEDGKVRIIAEDCLGCGLCARFCPYKAIAEVR